MAHESNRKKKKKIALWAGLFIALLGGIGVGLQNTFAVFDLLVASITVSNAIPCALLAGGCCSTLVNFFLNADLLYNFWERISKKPYPTFYSTAHEVQYWLGIIIFIITGVLFGLTAFSVAASAVGGLAALDGFGIAGIVAGVFVALISVPQELETWLASFEHPVTAQLGKAFDELEALNSNETDYDSLKREILRELYDTLKAKVVQQISDIEKFRATRPLIVKAKLNELKKWFAGIAAFNKINNDIHALIARINAAEEIGVKANIEKEELDAILNAINAALLNEIQNSFNNFQHLDVLKKAIEAPIRKKQESLTIFGAIAESFTEWKDNLSFGKFIGLILSLANVMSLSLLFTIGLTTFLSYIGVPAFPALIAGFSLAFTAGAYTEFYFYHYFLSDFCDQFFERWQELANKPNPVIGIVLVGVNASVNGAVAYFSIQMLEALFIAAGIPVPSLMPLCIVSAVFGSVASFLLGSDFWIQNAKRFSQWITGNTQEKDAKEEDISDKELFGSEPVVKPQHQIEFFQSSDSEQISVKVLPTPTSTKTEYCF